MTAETGLAANAAEHHSALVKAALSAQSALAAGTLMIQGTTSDAGKTTLVAGLCRLFHRRGVSVAPFKPQNMALNSAVTSNGGEIGRSQALQAQASGLQPHTDMNPVLLKPNSDTGAQVIIDGHPIANMEAGVYHDYKPRARAAVLAAHARLRQRYALVIAEGAGSPAEINLRAGDIANMGFAEVVNCPVILIADIDRGGVFAHLIGTLALLSATEQARVVGFVINRFRGDLALLRSGLDWLETKTDKPVLGVVPYLSNLHLDAEDALIQAPKRSDALLRVAVPVFSRISNHTDFDSLRLHPQVELEFVRLGQPLPACDLIILPGTKSVRRDLALLRESGWEAAIHRHLRYGGKLLGICGGFQMLGREITDPDGIESTPGSSIGLGLLDIATCLMPHKQLYRVSGQLTLGQARVEGYEIHCGLSSGPALANPLVIFDRDTSAAASTGTVDGAIGEGGQVLGSYIHGLLDHPEALTQVLAWAGLVDAQSVSLEDIRETQLERLADSLEACLDETWLAGLAASREDVY